MSNKGNFKEESTEQEGNVLGTLGRPERKSILGLSR